MNILNSIKRQIPNTITLCNLTCGVLASIYAVKSEITSYDTFTEGSDPMYLGIAATFILLGIFFDFFDGLSARLLKVSSPLGKELDSLADVITSGIAPGLILFEILSTSTNLVWLKYIALLTPALAAYRLAKFNLDTRQSHSFLGLPTPANALIWVGIAYIYCFAPVSEVGLLFENTGLLAMAIISVCTAILMIGELPMFSLKFNFKDMSWKTNQVQYIFLAGCVALIIALRQFSLSFVILWYIALSLIINKKKPSHE